MVRSPDAKAYKHYIGPSGATAKSVVGAWRVHNGEASAQHDKPGRATDASGATSAGSSSCEDSSDRTGYVTDAVPSTPKSIRGTRSSGGESPVDSETSGDYDASVPAQRLLPVENDVIMIEGKRCTVRHEPNRAIDKHKFTVHVEGVGDQTYDLHPRKPNGVSNQTGTRWDWPSSDDQSDDQQIQGGGGSGEPGKRKGGQGRQTKKCNQCGFRDELHHLKKNCPKCHAKDALCSTGGGTSSAAPPADPTPVGGDRDEAEKEDEEDREIRAAVEYLVLSPSKAQEEAGFVRFDKLLLSDDILRLVKNYFVCPMQELHGGDKSSAPSAGLLLTGPPGTGKTALARAIAVEANANLMKISNSTVLSQWAGKADRTVAMIFQVAKERAPCVIFFDEVEKLLQSTASRSTDGHSNVTNEFKAQMDPDALSKQNVVVIATTNHISQLEVAVLDRLGDFVRKLPPLTDDQREKLLRRALPTDHQLTDADIKELVKHVEGGSIRLLQGLGRIIQNAARDDKNKRVPPTSKHVMQALAEAKKTADEKEKAMAARTASG